MMTSTSNLAGSSCCMPEDEVRIDVHMLAYMYDLCSTAYRM